MALLAYTIFTITLVLQRKAAAAEPRDRAARLPSRQSRCAARAARSSWAILARGARRAPYRGLRSPAAERGWTSPEARARRGRRRLAGRSGRLASPSPFTSYEADLDHAPASTDPEPREPGHASLPPTRARSSTFLERNRTRLLCWRRDRRLRARSSGMALPWASRRTDLTPASRPPFDPTPAAVVARALTARRRRRRLASGGLPRLRRPAGHRAADRHRATCRRTWARPRGPRHDDPLPELSAGERQALQRHRHRADPGRLLRPERRRRPARLGPQPGARRHRAALPLHDAGQRRRRGAARTRARRRSRPCSPLADQPDLRHPPGDVQPRHRPLRRHGLALRGARLGRHPAAGDPRRGRLFDF